MDITCTSELALRADGVGCSAIRVVARKWISSEAFAAAVLIRCVAVDVRLGGLALGADGIHRWDVPRFMWREEQDAGRRGGAEERGEGEGGGIGGGSK